LVSIDHVSTGKAFVEVAPVVSADEKGVYILFAATLLGEEPTFNGSGTCFK